MLSAFCEKWKVIHSSLGTHPWLSPFHNFNFYSFVALLYDKSQKAILCNRSAFVDTIRMGEARMLMVSRLERCIDTKLNNGRVWFWRDVYMIPYSAQDEWHLLPECEHSDQILIIAVAIRYVSKKMYLATHQNAIHISHFVKPLILPQSIFRIWLHIKQWKPRMVPKH